MVLPWLSLESNITPKSLTFYPCSLSPMRSLLFNAGVSSNFCLQLPFIFARVVICWHCFESSITPKPLTLPPPLALLLSFARQQLTSSCCTTPAEKWLWMWSAGWKVREVDLKTLVGANMGSGQLSPSLPPSDQGETNHSTEQAEQLWHQAGVRSRHKKE